MNCVLVSGLLQMLVLRRRTSILTDGFKDRIRTRVVYENFPCYRG